jgi:hypothetical protein
MHSTVSRTVGLIRSESWGDRPKRLLVSLVACLALFATTPASPFSSTDNAPRISVIVRELPGFGGDLRGLVEDLGGRVGVGLGIIDVSWPSKSWSSKSWSTDLWSSHEWGD